MSEPKLPQRMRDAADVIELAREERHRRRGDQAPWPVSDFVSQDLRRLAGEWQEQDRVAEEKLLAIHAADLARVLDCAYKNNKIYDARWVAEMLVKSGWRKSDPA